MNDSFNKIVNLIKNKDNIKDNELKEVSKILQSVWNDKKFVAELNEGGCNFFLYFINRISNNELQKFPFTDHERLAVFKYLNNEALGTEEAAQNPDYNKLKTLKEMQDEVMAGKRSYEDMVKRFRTGGEQPKREPTATPTATPTQPSSS